MKLLVSKSFILVNSAGATKDQLLLSEAVSSQVDNLIRELKLTFLETKTAFHLEIESVELVGGTSQIQNLGAYLTQGLEIPANPNTQVLAGTPAKIEITPQLEMIAPVALGLAIEGLKRQRNPPINLRKNEFSRENLSLKKLLDRWRVPAQIALAAFVLFFIYSFARDQIASSLDTSADERVSEAALKAASLKGQAASEAGIGKYLKTQRDRISHQEAISQLDDYITAVEIVTKISDKFPMKAPPGQDVDVTLIDVSDGDVIIKGRAHSAAQIALIQKSLNDVAEAKTLATMPAPEVSGGMPFGFKMRVKRKKL
jgi:general secretion pathway protein L